MNKRMLLLISLAVASNTTFADLACTNAQDPSIICQAADVISAHQKDVTNAILQAPVGAGEPATLPNDIAILFNNTYSMPILTTTTFTGTPNQPSTYSSYLITGGWDCLGPPNNAYPLNPPDTMQGMWIRDAAAQLHSYLGIYKDTQHTYPGGEINALNDIMIGFINTAATDLSKNPTAHGFNADGSVDSAGTDYEMDTLAFFIWFSYDYWKASGQTVQFNANYLTALEKIFATIKNYQYININGQPLTYTGMSYSQNRASDDPTELAFNIPDNMFITVALQDAQQILSSQAYATTPDIEQWISDCQSLQTQIQNGINKYGVVDKPPFGKVYAYEVDGAGNNVIMDDANLPSLLSAPYLGFSGDPTIMANTRAMILSANNPYYFVTQQGGPPSPMTYQGIGSPHTASVINAIWPLALVAQGITEQNNADQTYLLQSLYSSAQFSVGNSACISDTPQLRQEYPAAGYLHESFSSVDPMYSSSRGWFAWPNAFFAEWVDDMAANNHFPWSTAS